MIGPTPFRAMPLSSLRRYTAPGQPAPALTVLHLFTVQATVDFSLPVDPPSGSRRESGSGVVPLTSVPPQASDPASGYVPLASPTGVYDRELPSDASPATTEVCTFLCETLCETEGEGMNHAHTYSSGMKHDPDILPPYWCALRTHLAGDRASRRVRVSVQRHRPLRRPMRHRPAEV